MEYILIIEDDTDINNLMTEILKKNHYKVMQAFSGTEGKLRLEMDVYDLIILDLMLPGLSGEELILHIRENIKCPIIVVTAKTDVTDKVNLLKKGADDYITKPFAKDELLARVEAQIRRYKEYSSQRTEKHLVQYKKLTLNMNDRTVILDGNLLPFTISEFDILSLLMQDCTKVHSKNAIYTKVWQGTYMGEENTINVHISNIRGKIARFDEDEYIKTVWGIGFKMS